MHRVKSGVESLQLGSAPNECRIFLYCHLAAPWLSSHLLPVYKTVEVVSNRIHIKARQADRPTKHPITTCIPNLEELTPFRQGWPRGTLVQRESPVVEDDMSTINVMGEERHTTARRSVLAASFLLPFFSEAQLLPSAVVVLLATAADAATPVAAVPDLPATAPPCFTTTQFPKPPSVVNDIKQRSLVLPPWHVVPAGILIASC